MNSHAQLPSAYRASKSSDYRKRMAALGEPLPEEVRKRIGFAKALWEAAPKPEDILLDLPALRESMLKIGKMAMVNGFVPSRPYSNGYELFRDLFYEHGVFVDTANSGLCAGPIISQGRIRNLDVFLTAFAEPQERASFYGPERPGLGMPPRIIIDLAHLLEIAAYRINMVRYGELEPISSALFSPHEQKQGPSRQLFRQRMKKLIPDGGLKETDFRRLFHDLSEGKNDDAAINSAFNRMMILRFTGLGVKAADSQDEAGHTLKLVNDILHSALVSHITMHMELERLKARNGIDPNDHATCKAFFDFYSNHLFLVGWLADIAYGDPLFRMGYLSQHAAATNDPAVRYFKVHGTRRLLEIAGLQSRDHMDSFFRILSCPPDTLRSAARELLDSIYRDLTGTQNLYDGFGSFYGMGFGETLRGVQEAFQQAREVISVTRSQLPLIARAWHESGVNDF